MTQDDEDWRAFRAKLVMQSQKPSSTSTRNSLDDDADDVDGIGALFDTGGAWAYDSGNVIEEGAVILGGLDQEFGFGLRQQYFHKTVILVLEHDATFTKGIILNRPTNMYLDDDWRLAFGGDVHGNGDNPEIICLHSLQQEQVVQASRPVMKDIQWTTFQNAKQLVARGLAKPADFFVFGGYAGWGPGQLLKELDRKSWYMMATDGQTLLNQLENSNADLAGLETWNLLMRMIGRKETVDDFSGDSFDDLMLKEWARDNLLSPDKGGGGKALDNYNSPQVKTGAAEIKVGTLVRASSQERSPFLLAYQEFHKSLVLVLADNEEMTIGVILNRPSTTGFEISTRKQDTREVTSPPVIVPLRYGGEYKIQGDEPILWLHCNPTLREAKIGTEIGASTIYNCTSQDLATAIGSGLATPFDFLAFQGVTAWTKGKSTSVNGMQGEVENGKFEVVPVEKTDLVFLTMSQQSVLDQLNMVQNLAVAKEAWTLGGLDDDHDDELSEEGASFVFNSDVRVGELTDAALRCWVATHLLGKPTLGD